MVLEAAFGVRILPWSLLSWVASPGHHPPCLSFPICQMEGEWGHCSGSVSGLRGAGMSEARWAEAFGVWVVGSYVARAAQPRP